MVPISSLVAAGWMLPVDPASSQEGIEEVVVTGSRLGRSDLDSTLPITVLDETRFEITGHQTIEDFIQDLPMVNGGDFGSTINNGNPGIATVGLRGLGPNRTLVLVNGHRPPPVGVDGIVDLNLIPSAAIERVEVLRDGASTVYGSDAVAGVVNFITKTNFEGVELSAQYDVTGESDGEQYGLSLTLGNTFDRGNFLLSAQATEREVIMQGDRDFSACPLSEVDGQLICSGSGTTYPASISPSVDSGSYIVDQETGIARPFGAADAFNYAATSFMVTPQEVRSLYGAANYDLLPEGISTVRFTLEGMFANRESDQLLAPEGTFWGPEIPANHPDNPFGDVLCASNPFCTAPQSVFIARRIAESEGRRSSQDATVWQLVGGVEGEFQNGIVWDLSYNYGDWNDSQRELGRANQPRFDEMLTPDLCAANPDCPDVWNPFSIGTLTPEQQAYAFVNPNESWRSKMRILQFNVAGDSGEFELPGGPLEWAVGFERRSEKASVYPDGAALLGQVYFVSGEITEGQYTVEEPYAEVRLPLVAGVTGADLFAIEASVRQSDYDFLESSETNSKLAIEWAPFTNLRFRAVTGDGFRAPNIGELFAPEQQTAASYTEPCLNWGANSNQVIRDNCAADGLPPNFSLTSDQANGLQGGNPDLQPEESETTMFGVVFTPEALSGFSMTLDWFDIDIENAIGAAGTDNIITGCYASPGFSSPLCALIEGPAVVERAPHPTSPRRDFLGNVAGQRLTDENLATFTTTGLDFQFDYGMEGNFAQWDFTVSGTWLDTYEFQAFPGGPILELQGKFGTDPYQGDVPAAFPDLQTNVIVRMARDNWGLSLINRFQSSVDDLNADEANLVNSIDSYWYHDLQGYYRWREAEFTLGVRNLTDKKPPYVTSNHDMNTLPFSYDTAGRYFYARASVSF
ncbi:MAG: TonB-dependent receptor [Gammaproteobacteria bacterium]|nr:TonB-dependent receptor [Gammaproteobacteria bacterium]